MPVGTSAAEIYSKLRLHILSVGGRESGMPVAVGTPAAEIYFQSYICTFGRLARVSISVGTSAAEIYST